jgi:hypothetical protein
MVSIYLLGFYTSAQEVPIHVTLIGMTHHFKSEYLDAQELGTVNTFIYNLDPDIICIEAIPPEDTSSLKEILPKTMKRSVHVRDTLPYFNTCPRKVYKGANRYSAYDYWNAYYQWYLAEQSGDSLGYFSAFYPDQSNSEFGLIIFPGADRLKKNELYGIDYREGEDEFLEKNNRVLKKLFFSFKWKPIRTYLKARKEYKKAEKSGSLLAFINSSAFQHSFSNLINELPNRLPKSEDAIFIKSYWQNRNRIMAERVIAIASAQNAQNVLVTVGGAHVLELKKYLEEEGHTVQTYGELMGKAQ